jgi:ribonuclease HI
MALDIVRVVYTDGACSGNPGPGGWAWAVAPDGAEFGQGSDPHTTNQRMEITAALQAIRVLLDERLTVVSDSSYVVRCFNDKWWRTWRTNGWRTSARKPVANRDLWEPLVELYLERGGAANIVFEWVKGHSGDFMNDLVDGLAVEAALAARSLP